MEPLHFRTQARRVTEGWPDARINGPRCEKQDSVYSAVDWCERRGRAVERVAQIVEPDEAD
jgi:hypothetical protein